MRSGTPHIRETPVDDGLRLEAWLEEACVGAVMARPVALFEHEQFCHVEVDEEHRRSGIGTLLWAALDDRVPAGEALITRVLHADTEALGFAGSIGWDLVEHCPAPRAQPHAAEWRAWARAQPTPAGTVVTATDQVSAAGLEDAFVDWYVWAHEMIGPLRPRSVIAAAAAGTAGELDHEVSRVAMRDGRIVALSLLFEEAPDGLQRVIVETTRPDEPDGTALVAATLAGTLDACAARGNAAVELEGRTIDPHLPVVIATFPPHDSAPMSVVRLRRRADRART